jgi:hypothetical protein
MRAHLTGEQFSRRMLGERSANAEAHLQECAQCEAEVVQLAATLTEFRSSVRAWSEQQDRPRWASAQATAKGNRAWMTGAYWAAAALLTGLVFGGYLPQRPAKMAATTPADTVLLTEWDRQVSRTVPGPMEPLTRLVSWDEN